MNTRLTYSLVLFSIAPLVTLAQSPKISTPAARQATLKIVETMLGEKPLPVFDAEAQKDPFYPPGKDLQEDYDPNAVLPSAVRRTDADLLQEIAKLIQPTGSVILGGEPYLLFGEKRRKKGDKVMVMVEEVEYEAEIVSIDKNRFKIRYNNVETIRSIN